MAETSKALKKLSHLPAADSECHAANRASSARADASVEHHTKELYQQTGGHQDANVDKQLGSQQQPESGQGPIPAETSQNDPCLLHSIPLGRTSSPSIPSPIAADPGPLSQQDASRSSEASDREWWPLKWIQWPPEVEPGCFQEIRGIVMQKENGPCSFIALCNILLLRGDISVPPEYERTIPFDILAGLLANFILTLRPEMSDQLDSIFQTIAKTRIGLDVNPRFGSYKTFEVPSDHAAEVSLFEQAKVPLVHGWLVDRQDRDCYEALVERSGHYDQATLRMTQADELTNGLLLSGDVPFEALLQLCQPRSAKLTPEELQLLKDGCLLRDFLRTNPSQLSFPGLFELISVLEPGSLSAFFRSNHVAVLYRANRSTAPLLFTLVTDSAFLHAPNEAAIWESLETIEGGDHLCRSDLSIIKPRDATSAQEESDRRLAEQLQLESQSSSPHSQPREYHNTSSNVSGGAADMGLAANKSSKKKKCCIS